MHKFFMSAILLTLLAVGLPGRSADAQGEQCFPETRQCVGGRFLGYWSQNGGLPVFGFPVAGAGNEVNRDTGQTYLTQWFERNRFEMHPENRAPYDVLLGRLGDDMLLRKGINWQSLPREPGPKAGCLWFQQTGHNVCNQAGNLGFRTYWQSNGLRDPRLNAYGRSLALFGLPLTEPRMETNTSGDTVLTQWFERARFEWHPNKPNQFKVLLGLLGNEVRNGGSPQPQPQPAGAPTIFGVEINPGNVAATAARATEAAVTWTRYNGIVWSEIERVQGTRDWSRASRVDTELQALAARGLTPVVIIRGTPAWAQRVPGSACGPIKADALDDFAGFMREVVTRYSRPPYNVKHWELWNEPDIDPSVVPGESIFGCLGNDDDPYYGGGDYATMLKQIYPAIKQADAAARVVIGGLLLDCDPAQPPAGKDCKPARFFEGILRNGGGDSFDIVAYHAYTFWIPGTQDWDREQPSWKHRGGALLGKLDYLRKLQAQYGVNKPILMNEGGLLCYPGGICPNNEFLADQANYAVRLYSRAWANGLIGAVWYTLDAPGWREGNLLDTSQAPRPAYQTVKFMANLLKDATYANQLSNNQLEGYAFRKGNATYQVYWTNDGTARSVGLPAGTSAVYDKLGQRITTSGGSINVGFEPIFIQVGTP